MGRKRATILYHRMIDDGDNPTVKPCARCDRWLELSEFGVDKARKDGLCNYCSDCARIRYREWVAANKERHRASTKAWRSRQGPEYGADKHRKHRYGLPEGEYDRMVEAQDGKCAICDEVPAKRLIVDHDHNTNAVRGLLCYTCNRGLHMIEAPGRMDAALAYLEEHARANDQPTPESVEPPM